MRKLQRAAIAAALAAAGLAVAGAAANAATAAPGHPTQAATASWDGGASVRANERVVEAFLQDVINEHHGDHAAGYLNPGMQWSGGTVGTVTGSANVAGLFAGVVAAFPDAHITIQSCIGETDRTATTWTLVGTHRAPFNGISATGRKIQFAGIEFNRFADGRIAEHFAQFDLAGLLVQLGAMPV